MATKEEREMEAIARALNDVLAHVYGKMMGFFLVAFEFHTGEYASFVSNGDREDIIKALREAADVLEQKQDVPPTIGEA